MKDKKIFIAIIAIIIISCFFSLYTLKKDTLTAVTWLSSMSVNVSKESWNDVTCEYGALIDHWNSINKIWSMIIPHAEIDDINIYLVKLSSYISSEDKIEALALIQVLITMFNHIPEKESPHLENII